MSTTARSQPRSGNPMLTGARAVQPRRTRHHRRLGRAVGVPHLAAVHGQPLGQLRRARLAAEDQQPHRLERLGGPQRRQRRHRRHHGDVAGHQPRAQVHAAAHQRARRGHQAGAVPPGQPHLLARRVERDRQSGQHPVAGPNGVVLQEHLRFRVDERGGAVMGDRDTLRGAGGSGREDDPGVVATQRRPCAPSPRRAGPADQSLLGDDPHHVGLAEHQLGPFLGVVGVDRYVRRAGGQRREDRHIQRVTARRHPDADAVTAADAAGGEPLDAFLDVADQLGVGELDRAVVERGRVGMAGRGVVEDVDERARFGRRRRQQVLRWDVRLRVSLSRIQTTKPSVRHVA